SGLTKADYIVDAASGVSGAGRSVALRLHFAEAADSFSAYGVKGHRHLAEMHQQLDVAGDNGTPRITFVPHLVPMVRGILATCYFDLEGSATLDQLVEEYRMKYGGSAFVKLVDEPPSTKDVAGTNRCHIHVTHQGDRVVA